ncbi:MAG: MarR family transcriptional regulator, partial [Myxococcota bacterium]
RVASRADGRRIGLVLSAAGRVVQDRVAEHRRARFAAVLAKFPPDERARFAVLLTAFVDGLDATFRPGSAGVE